MNGAIVCCLVLDGGHVFTSAHAQMYTDYGKLDTSLHQRGIIHIIAYNEY